MNLNPILKVLSTFQKHRVRALLIGGQACIVHGAAEFSRDSDFVLLATPGNLRTLQDALAELSAEPIYVPPLRADYLERGHACHFRCRAAGVEGLRVDLMAKLRGCDEFGALWRRRTTVALEGESRVEVIGLHDLVQSKKTQRDKDWLMLRRLVDNDMMLHQSHPAASRVRWWLMECRSIQNLLSLADRFSTSARQCIARRPLVEYAIRNDIEALQAGLADEERIERDADRLYWAPLREELEDLRHTQARDNRSD